MAVKTWYPIKIRFCEHAGSEVALEVEAVYPADFLPDQSPRIQAHRCSKAYLCSLDNQPSCVWAGTNPTYDPFVEKG